MLILNEVRAESPSSLVANLQLSRRPVVLASAKATRSDLIIGFKNHPKEPAGVNRQVVGQHTALQDV